MPCCFRAEGRNPSLLAFPPAAVVASVVMEVSQGTSVFVPATTIAEAMVRQAPTDDGWVCPGCRFWTGGVGCSANVFISVEGANMSGCTYRKPRCQCRKEGE